MHLLKMLLMSTRLVKLQLLSKEKWWARSVRRRKHASDLEGEEEGIIGAAGTLSWADFDAEVAETLDQMKKWEIRLMA